MPQERKRCRICQKPIKADQKVHRQCQKSSATMGIMEAGTGHKKPQNHQNLNL